MMAILSKNGLKYCSDHRCYRAACEVVPHTHNVPSERMDVPQGADESIGGSLCIQGADVPNV